MEIEHCLFPDELLYDLDNNTWLEKLDDGDVLVGVTSLLSALAGRLTSATPKTVGTVLQRGRSLATLESLRFVGPVPSPVAGTITGVNRLVVERPKVLNDSPYEEGWIARIEPSSIKADSKFLTTPHTAERILRDKIAQFRARCFKAFPDHEMFEIGVECSAVLVRLNDLMAVSPKGEVVHIVSDDPTAYVEMQRWVDQTGNSLVEWRTEGNLYHFVVRKTTGSRE